jgi:hypothetical protein
VLAYGAALPTALFMISTMGHTSGNTPLLYNRRSFLEQYTNGIYRYRVLSRELILALSRLVQTLGIYHQPSAVDAANGAPDPNLYVAVTLVNGTSFIAFTLLLYLVTVRRRGWLAPYLIMVALVAASGYVVTPYDFLSYLFITAALAAAFANRRWSWRVCLVIAVLGTATRESFFVVVAAVIAVRLAQWRRQDEARSTLHRVDGLWASTIALTVGSAGTYLLLRVFLTKSSDSSTIMESILGSANFHPLSLVAVIITVLGFFSLIAAFPRDVTHDGLGNYRYGRTTLLFWLFSSPYLGVSIVSGIWSEALRLVMPMMICQYMLYWFATGEAVQTPRSS